MTLRDPLRAERDENLRRLSRLTWRTTQLGAVAVAGIAILFSKHATASAAPPVRPAPASPGQGLTDSLSNVLTQGPTYNTIAGHHHRRPPAAAHRGVAAPAAPPAYVPPPAPPPAPPAPAPAPPVTHSGGSGGGG